jgi:predicted DNA-binding transcriptional regulator YafY
MEEYFQGRPKGRVPRLELNRKETLILYLILSRNTALYETGLKKTIEALKKRLEKFHLETEEESLTDRYAKVFLSVPRKFKKLKGKESLVEDLINAAMDQKSCQASYWSFKDNRGKDLMFNPLRFYEWNDGLYCFIETLPDREIRTTAVERFSGLTVTDRTFIQPEGFDPEKMLSSSWAITWDNPMTLSIRFSPEVSRYIQERQWTENQKVIRESGGSVILKMKTSGRRDVKSWILSFGKHAEVLEPEDLRREIQQESADLSALYDRT